MLRPAFLDILQRKDIDFSNELLCILLTQGAAKLPDVEVLGPKKRSDPSTNRVRFNQQNQA